MRVVQGPSGTESVIYEKGDLVRLRRDEDGPIVTVFAGDWGRVTQVHPCGALDIKLAGYGRSKSDRVARATAVPCRLVEPCDNYGKPLQIIPGVVWNTRGERTPA
jgi:hypothetical protein